jgi:putative nucleotidyltransferase with HDIG domain
VVPLLLVLHFTFKTSMQRVEDANKHVDQLNTLYLSTIETLAMAVDAKDQVTHGHIRRVQSQATRLAREVGVRDDKLMRAIEAAALLHDMGKLAVPEYILNKPGKLSAAEFEKMKLHASVGADMLSSIDFPYPVVPIVRHHHENWDGTGYPSGLSGTQIPIGARILAVVDCFDALTSDRPYRQRLSREDAFDILAQRRGSMYDPLVVDEFIKVNSSGPPNTSRKDPPSDVLDSIARSTRASSRHMSTQHALEFVAKEAKIPVLQELERLLGRGGNVRDSAEAVAGYLYRLTGTSLCVVYVYNPASDEIEVGHAIGHGASAVRGVRIPLGQRLSGWVAANLQTVCNSEPALDFGDVADFDTLGLRSSISTPVIVEEQVVGVVTLYSVEGNWYDDGHRRTIESVARTMAKLLKQVTIADVANTGH